MAYLPGSGFSATPAGNDRRPPVKERNADPNLNCSFSWTSVVGSSTTSQDLDERLRPQHRRRRGRKSLTTRAERHGQQLASALPRSLRSPQRQSPAHPNRAAAPPNDYHYMKFLNDIFK